MEEHEGRDEAEVVGVDDAKGLSQEGRIREYGDVDGGQEEDARSVVAAAGVEGDSTSAI